MPRASAFALSRSRLIASSTPVVRLDALAGRWRRSLLVRPDGSRDTGSIVDWLQGPTLYGDLRQPVTLPRFDGVRRLRDLTIAQVEALATQEGFAGTLIAHADHFEWTRLIDIQPPQVNGDRGRLSDHGDVMIEDGYETPYVEQWHRLSPVGPRCGAMVLRDVETGVCGLIVRVEDDLLYARGRRLALAGPGSLLEKVRLASDLAAAQDLVDCEVSIGRIGGSIERSTLPYRVGTAFGLVRSGRVLTMEDVAPDGAPCARRWAILDSEGDILEGGL